MIALKKFTSALCSLSLQRPSYMFMKGLEKYKLTESQQQQLESLINLEERLKKKEFTDKDLVDLIQKKQFKTYIESLNLKVQFEEEEEVDNESNLNSENAEKKQKLAKEVLSLLQSNKIDRLNKFSLYEQTVMLNSVYNNFVKTNLQLDFFPPKTIVMFLLEVICRQHNLLFQSSKTAPAFDLKQFSSLVQNFQRKDVLENLSLLDIALLLEVDQIIFKKQIQSQLMNQAYTKIMKIQTFDPSTHEKALHMIFLFVRKNRLSLTREATLFIHLVNILPIKVLSNLMKLVKITNFDVSELTKIYTAMHKTHLQTYKAENIPLLSTMNVFMPAQTAATFYFQELQKNFDQGNYLELMEMMPDFVRLFYPKQEYINYLCDKLQVKLSTSNYSLIDTQATKEQKIIFMDLLSKFLVSILHADIIKNDFFLIKTLMFVNNNFNVIQDRNVQLQFSYFFNQIYENEGYGTTPLNQNIKELIENFNKIFPPRQKLPNPSNTETKIYKFLLQTNHFALQNVKVGSFNIDIYVHPDIIVEYNGYDHYKYDFKLKSFALDQYTNEHLYREKQLKKLKNYKIANINFKQWSALYELEKQHLFLTNLILKQE